MADTKNEKYYHTTSGLKTDPVYSPQNSHLPDYKKDLADPGSFPYTRGIHKEMYRSRLWTMRLYSGFGTAYETNQRFKYLLSQGLTGLSVAFDLPTQMGYDSDHPLAKGEVGKTGVAICTLDDMETLFAEIPQDKISVSMTINATAPILLALYCALAEKRKVSFGQLSGTIQNDILKEYIARKTYIFPPRPSLRLIADVFKYCRTELPRWNTISISGYHMREAGATAVQELAFTFANAICYVQNALDSGLGIDDFAKQLSFFFISGSDFMEEIAKFRAARRMWAKIMRERFHAGREESWKLRFHTQTSGSSLTAQQIDNNVVRVTMQALAAVLGGTQSLHTNSKDEALALPTPEAVQLALRTQQIIAHESKVTNTADPLGGSFYLEHLTNELEKNAWAYIDQIEKSGGALKSIEEGFYQQEISKSSYEYQKQVESGEEIIVGVNAYQTDQEQEPEIYRPDPKVAQEQIKRLSNIKKRRDTKRVEESLKRLSAAAGGTENMLPPILDCVRSCCTLGEICDTLRQVWGEHKETG
ncbi:MAG: methylmalonyl-CoA mutase family protein [candidate division Zixibacteria bacterium]|nr:methylmalonyl-CoA mutase family protein [candidate division Zixibacteria bacterium]